MTDNINPVDPIDETLVDFPALEEEVEEALEEIEEFGEKKQAPTLPQKEENENKQQINQPAE